MEHILAHFQEYLILGLIGALFFKETIIEYVNAKLGKEKEEKVPQWGQRLVQYANHDTTERLIELIEMEKQEHLDADVMRETMRDMNRTLLEIKEYGIKVRRD